MKTFFLFGSQAVDLYLDNEFPRIITKLNESDYSTFCFDSDVNTPIELLNEFNGWGDYTEIMEFEYNILNDIE